MSKDKKIVLLSGGIGVGKTTIMTYLIQNYGFESAECKEKLFDDVCNLFSVPKSLFYQLYEHRILKETPDKNFILSREAFERLRENIPGIKDRETTDGNVMLSPREAMIYTSECVFKPSFGPAHYGNERIKKMNRSSSTLFVDGSAAFPEEVDSLLNHVGLDNIYLLRIFSNDVEPESSADSRKMLTGDNLKPENVCDIHNDHEKPNDPESKALLFKTIQTTLLTMGVI